MPPRAAMASVEGQIYTANPAEIKPCEPHIGDRILVLANAFRQFFLFAETGEDRGRASPQVPFKTAAHYSRSGRLEHAPHQRHCQSPSDLHNIERDQDNTYDTASTYTHIHTYIRHTICLA
ncbi:hypothetical protein IF1G_02374 [Cordyceps javanica]|uniref:Uncharacterized protein n=1 Tax=Cordyceps javanica TaxID=43265 RepID=A0A545V993_9HYPO|nr:hypothetical protein IF1G_02374 [Cordyceps javanica]